MSKAKKLLLFLFIFGTTQLLAQSAKSPFSAFGVGDFTGTSLANNQGMAGVGISNPQYWYINNQNPALLVFNTLTTFHGGIMGERVTTSDGTLKEKNTNGNMNYLLLGFPIKRGKWVNSISLAPYSSSNYRFSYSDVIDGSTDLVKVTEEGSGGINSFSWSHGVALHKTLSVGGSVNYLFSSMERSYYNQLTSTDQSLLYIPAIYQRYHFSDVKFTGAISFHKDSLFQKNYRLNIGVVYDFQADVNTTLLETLERRSAAGVTDSTTLRYNERGQTTLPSKLSLGVSFGKGDRWVFAADYAMSDFTTYKQTFDIQMPTYKKGQKIAVGGEFTPDATSLSNYLKRMTYRTGVSYEEMPYLINGKPLKDFGINFGFSAPVSRVSSLDVAVRWGKRGTVADNQIEENYFKIYFGVTFNDQWFIKRRFD